jgi:hypothetical protein
MPSSTVNNANFIMNGVKIAGAKRFSTCSLENIKESLSLKLRLRCLSGTTIFAYPAFLGDIEVF